MCVKTVGDKTTTRSNSHFIFTFNVKHDQNEIAYPRLCGGLIRLNNVFIFNLKLLPSALLPHRIAPKRNKLIGDHSSSVPL